MFLLLSVLGVFFLRPQITIGIGNEVRDSTIQLTQMVCCHFPSYLWVYVCMTAREVVIVHTCDQ